MCIRDSHVWIHAARADVRQRRREKLRRSPHTSRLSLMAVTLAQWEHFRSPVLVDGRVTRNDRLELILSASSKSYPSVREYVFQ